jgi:cephalosporin hydroxylase
MLGGRVTRAVATRLGPRRTARIRRVVAPALSRDLTWLGRWYETDKAVPNMYTPLYERHLGHLRRRPIRILEIGIGGYDGGPLAGGESLRMWRSWMPRAEVVGIDLAPRDFQEPRITTLVGSQADADFLREVWSTHGPFDVVIDDGSHVSEHIRVSFEALWPLLASGGIYAIEDLGTSYETDYGGGPPGTPGTSMEMLKELLDQPNQDGSVRSLCVYKNIAFLERG